MIIYEAYNKSNGKSYIGLTTKTLEHRKSGHIRSSKSNSNTHFSKAIRKYGEESFEWSTLLKCNNFDELCRLEKMVISLHEPCQLYNISSGGDAPSYGMKHSEKTKRICGEYSKKRWEGNRAKDKWPEWVFRLGSYKEAKEFGVPKTTWYRHRLTQGG